MGVSFDPIVPFHSHCSSTFVRCCFADSNCRSTSTHSHSPLVYLTWFNPLEHKHFTMFVVGIWEPARRWLPSPVRNSSILKSYSFSSHTRSKECLCYFCSCRANHPLFQQSPEGLATDWGGARLYSSWRPEPKCAFLLWEVWRMWVSPTALHIIPSSKSIYNFCLHTYASRHASVQFPALWEVICNIYMHVRCFHGIS